MKKYYFVSYVVTILTPGKEKTIYYNIGIDGSPLEWLRRKNQDDPSKRYRILFWNEISEPEYEMVKNDMRVY